MTWQSYLRGLVPKVAGAAAGAATLPGGPIAAAAAGKTAEVISDDVLAQFLDAQSDQIADLVRLNREMAGRLVEIQQGVDALLDGPWRTGLLHVGEAARNPRRRQTELEQARVELFRAWGIANTPYRRQAVEQELAALFAILNEPENFRHWIELAMNSHTEASRTAIAKFYNPLLDSIKRASAKRRQDELAFYGIPKLLLLVRTTLYNTPDPLFSAAREEAAFLGSDGNVYYDLTARTCYIYRDSELEQTIGALVELDAAGVSLRQTCVKAGIPDSSLPSLFLADGARRAVKVGSSAIPSKKSALVVFGPTLAAEIYPPHRSRPSPVTDPLPGQYAQQDVRSIESYWKEMFPHDDLGKIYTAYPGEPPDLPGRTILAGQTVYAQVASRRDTLQSTGASVLAAWA